MGTEPKATYLVTEEEILKISKLFGCLEEAIKELIRRRQMACVKHDGDVAEMYLYEMTSRAIYDGEEDPEIKSLSLKNIF